MQPDKAFADAGIELHHVIDEQQVIGSAEFGCGIENIRPAETLRKSEDIQRQLLLVTFGELKAVIG